MLYSEAWRTTQQTLRKNIPSYLYVEYNDDENLQAFVDAYNTIQQQNLDDFNGWNLPVYTQPQIAGTLLDWIAGGLYGQVRPVLPFGFKQSIGALNTWALNTIPLNTFATLSNSYYLPTTDDIFKRVITWNFYKGDGRVFNTQWLKRRILRFLDGVNGTAPSVADTSQISVTFNAPNQVNIEILSSVAEITLSTSLNSFALNTVPLNYVEVSGRTFLPNVSAPLLVSAINIRAVQLPFQYEFIATYIPPVIPGYFGNDGGVLTIVGGGYPRSAAGLAPGNVWNNGGVVAVVPGVVPNPAAPLMYYGVVTISQLLYLGGGNLPLVAGVLGSGSLWSNGGEVSIS